MHDMIEEYPDLHISISRLPVAKNWHVGEKYKIELEVEQLSMSKESTGFKIISVRDVTEKPIEQQSSEEFGKTLVKGLSGGKYQR